MKVFLLLTKKRLAIILGVLIIALFVVGYAASQNAGKIDGSTHQAREEYLNGLGYTIEETGIITKSIIIPEDFSEVYEEYNKLQKKAGFDLKNYRSKTATLYTYNLSGDEDRQIHLIVFEDTIIGGDIADIKLNGEMKPLLKAK